MRLSQFVPPSPSPTVSTSVFSMSASLFGPCKYVHQGLPDTSDGKESACNAGDPGLTPGLGRSSGEGNGNQLQYFCLENPKDRGAWQATVCGIAKSQK